MCFSKEASYVTGSLLIALGSYTFLSNKQKKLLPAACIPLFFGIQQLAEGNLWASFEAGLPVNLESFWNLVDINSLSAVLYLFIAFLLWPVWIPLSTFLPEKNPSRRFILGTILSMGIFVSSISLFSLQSNIITVKVIEHSIQYTPENHLLLPLNLFIALYGLTVVAPSFISSVRGFSLFGYSSLASLLISYYLYFNTFTSVWCFFSAWLSILIAMIIKAGNEEADTLVKQPINKL